MTQKAENYPLNISVPVQLTREQYYNVGSGAFTLGWVDRGFFGSTDLEIWDSPTGGTQLTEGVDYTLGGVNSYYTSAAGQNVYTTVTITNATYQTGSIYITYKTIGSFTDSAMYNAISTGWVPVNEPLTYASSTTVNTPNDLTNVITPGMKIKFTQSGTEKYFIVLAITSSLMTVAAGSSYTVANATISDIYISSADQPESFPAEFDWTPTFTNLTVGNGTLEGKYRIERGMLYGYFTLTFGSTTSIVTSPVEVDMPIPLLTVMIRHIDANVAFYDSSVGGFYKGFLFAINVNKIRILVENSAGTYVTITNLISTVPFTWGTGDEILCKFAYPVI